MHGGQYSDNLTNVFVISYTSDFAFSITHHALFLIKTMTFVMGIIFPENNIESS